MFIRTRHSLQTSNHRKEIVNTLFLFYSGLKKKSIISYHKRCDINFFKFKSEPILNFDKQLVKRVYSTASSIYHTTIAQFNSTITNVYSLWRLDSNFLFSIFFFIKIIMLMLWVPVVVIEWQTSRVNYIMIVRNWIKARVLFYFVGY